jgi:hypothetical protein
MVGVRPREVGRILADVIGRVEVTEICVGAAISNEEKEVWVVAERGQLPRSFSRSSGLRATTRAR